MKATARMGISSGSRNGIAIASRTRTTKARHPKRMRPEQAAAKAAMPMATRVATLAIRNVTDPIRSFCAPSTCCTSIVTLRVPPLEATARKAKVGSAIKSTSHPKALRSLVIC